MFLNYVSSVSERHVTCELNTLNFLWTLQDPAEILWTTSTNRRSVLLMSQACTITNYCTELVWSFTQINVRVYLLRILHLRWSPYRLCHFRLLSEIYLTFWINLNYALPSSVPDTTLPTFYCNLILLQTLTSILTHQHVPSYWELHNVA